jgi:hypothetical protein
VNENTQHGIYFESACKKVVISGGEFARNKDRGIYLVGCEDVSITGGNVLENGTYGIGIYNCPTISIEGGLFSGNKNGAGVLIDHTGVTAAKATITGGTFTQNSGYGGFHFARNVEYEISGNTLITENKTRGIYSNSPTPSSISGDVVIKGNKIMGDGGGISVLQGTVNISGNVTFEADTVTYLSNVGYDGGAIAVKEGASVVISGNVKIKDCVLVTTNTTNHGGSAIHVKGTAAKPGSLVMTGGSITGCKTTDNYGTVYAAEYGNITLNNVHIENNTAKYGGAIFVYKGGKVTLSGDTIRNNNTIAQVYNNDQGMLFTGNIHISGGRDGRLYLRDRCYFGEEDVLYLNSTDDRVYVDEALLSAGIAAFPLLSKNLTQGLEVVSPNGTTVSDASQFLTRFLLANTGAADADIALGLDKGGTDEKHIILVNQFFLDTRVADGLNTGVNPRMAFNSLSQLMSILNSPYTTIWVSGPVEVKADITLPAITTHHVNFRRYTGFAVAKQLYSVYDSVMFVIPQGKTLTIPGGNSATNTLTISGEGEGSDPAEASLFKNNGTLTIDGFVSLYFNPTAGNGSAIYQNGTLNLNGTVDFNTYSTNTIYLPEGRVINLDGFAATTNPAGITVETSPSDTHYPGRVIATGTTAGVPAGTEACFVNELTTAPLPIGRTTEGGRADLIFYLSDRNVAGVPIYITLQDAFAASATAGNDEVRLYGDTEEQIFIDRPVQYRSKGHAVAGSFTLDSTANVTLLDDLTTDTLYLRANMFSKKAQLDRGAHAITLRDAAYFDLMLPENPQQSDWYPVNLPFDVSLSDIRNLADTAAVLLFRKDYAVAAYDGQRRATYGIGNQPSNINNDWQYLATPLMTNGTGYMVSTGNIRTLRFKAANLNSVFSTSTSPMTYYMGTAGAPHQGINYLAQPMGANSTIAGGLSAGIIQVSETLSSDRIGWTSYVAKSVGSSPVIAPYTNYFHQTASTGFVSYAKSSASATVRSSPESSESLTDAPRYYELRLFDDDPQRYDALFVAASDLASADTYEIGRDVLKMGAAGRALRIWSHAFGVDLCANEVVMEGSSASIPVFIHLPEVGKIYTLRLENRTDEREQLWLYYGDRPVRELTKHPEYTMEGTGGTEEYSLRIFSGPTGQLPADLTGAYVYAENGCIVIAGLASGDGYIVSDISGRLFADGRSVGAPVRIPVANGAYVVRINGKSAKIIVSK